MITEEQKIEFQRLLKQKLDFIEKYKYSTQDALREMFFAGKGMAEEAQWSKDDKIDSLFLRDFVHDQAYATCIGSGDDMYYVDQVYEYFHKQIPLWKQFERAVRMDEQQKGNNIFNCGLCGHLNSSDNRVMFMCEKCINAVKDKTYHEHPWGDHEIDTDKYCPKCQHSACWNLLMKINQELKNMEQEIDRRAEEQKKKTHGFEYYTHYDDAQIDTLAWVRNRLASFFREI